MFGNPLSQLPTVVKNLLIINGIMFLATSLFENFMLDTFVLYYPASPNFKIFQLFTRMFMHADFMHLFFNMYALWMFGSMIERVWGGKKFLFYYLVAGFGAAGLHLFVAYLKVIYYESNIDISLLNEMKRLLLDGKMLKYGDANVTEWYNIMNSSSLGASGAVFGVLLAFGMMFPNLELQLIFPPIRLKAIWFVIIYGVLELIFGVTNTLGGIGHFAHIGGMLFGFILVKYWQHKGTLFRNDDYL
jgi:membrane associated rhomboid family serine protease